MPGKRVSGNQFFKIFCGRARGLRAFGVRGRPALPAAAPLTSTQSCQESMPEPSKSISPRTHMAESNVTTNDPADWCLSVTRMRCAKTAELMEVQVLFGVETLSDPRHIALDGGSRFPCVKGRESGKNFTHCKV